MGISIALIVLVVVLIAVRDEIADRLVDPAPVAPAATAATDLTAEEQAFYDFVAPRLVNVSAEANELVRLASGRSRNLIELQTRGARVDRGGREIDDYLSENGVPRRFDAAISDYRRGIAELRQGMEDARSGFLSFDWDRVSSAVDGFDAGAAKLVTALASLQRAGGATIPATAAPDASAV